jgi:phosphoenolpyruvate carboxylase
MALHNIERWARTWRGYRTATIHTAMRYDTDRGEYEHMGALLLATLGANPSMLMKRAKRGSERS